MNFYFNIENIDDKYFNEYIEKNNIDLRTIPFSKNLLFQKYYKTISFEKEKIDLLENNEDWDKMKKIGNPYELIYTNYNKKRKNDSISKYIPISRSYFKMWEIFYNFNLLKKFDSGKQHIFSHLAEGPGGFMEATYNYRLKNTNKSQIYDKFFGITLKPTTDFIPDWNKIKKIFNYNPNIVIDYGNLYYMKEVKSYIDKFNIQKAHLVTADGGFDYSSNFNGQEINSCQIIYSECSIALNILRKGGSFVCKVFDLFSITMVQILYILVNCFEIVHIYKPETSRPANSEKYLVCLYYKDNLSSAFKKTLLNVIGQWNNLSEKIDENESVIFNNIKVDNTFIQILNKYNEKYIQNQMYYLNKTIELSKSKLEKEQYHEIIQKQVENAKKWCTKYSVEINKESIYYQKNP
jgi:23S rRNA U2552 (ribose-2'-O)-methylase RlmE/FtsJ